MSLILNIDTATETAHISIAKNAVVIQEIFNGEQKDHAAFLQVGVRQLLQKAGLQVSAIDAIAVTTGPGSYTGLRVGMASAKGLAYALNKPLIGIGTLEMLAKAAIMKPGNNYSNDALFCPMIDARRMEVFTAVYNKDLSIILPPCALILEKDSFSAFFDKHEIIFLGTGSQKWQEVCQNKQAFFEYILPISSSLSALSSEKMAKKEFIDIAYSEPLYIKEFYMKSQQ